MATKKQDIEILIQACREVLLSDRNLDKSKIDEINELATYFMNKYSAAGDKMRYMANQYLCRNNINTSGTGNKEADDAIGAYTVHMLHQNKEQACIMANATFTYLKVALL